MELSPIGRERGADPVGAAKQELEVKPPFAIQGTERFGDDDYRRSQGNRERGLEEEDPAEDDAEPAIDTVEPTARLDVFV